MDQFYVIGKIVTTHALKGEVKIYSTTDFKEERYKVGNTLYIEKDGKMNPVVVKSYRSHKGYDLVTFTDYNDINAVLPFKNCKVYVSEEDIQDLDEDEYYYRQLIDCSVYHEGRFIGKVFNMDNYGASDLLFIRDENDEEILIPFVDDFIANVDIENKRIDIEVIEGLLKNED